MNHPTIERARNMLAGFACTLFASAALAENAARPPLAVWAIGLPNGFVTMEHQRSEIHVTAEDVERGEVRVPAGSRIVITTRSPQSHALDFHARRGFATAIRIEGIAAVVAEREAAGVTEVRVHTAAGRQVFELDYRFALAPDIVPGTYPWPPEIGVRRTLDANASAR